MILLNEGTHICTCLLLINKGLICRHFFRVGIYSQNATFHISIIPSRWYLDTNIQPDDLLQKYPSILVCGTTQLDSFEFNFYHFFSIQFDSLNSQSSQKSTKTIYAELFGLSKKVIDCAFKADM